MILFVLNVWWSLFKVYFGEYEVKLIVKVFLFFFIGLCVFKVGLNVFVIVIGLVDKVISVR